MSSASDPYETWEKSQEIVHPGINPRVMLKINRAFRRFPGSTAVFRLYDRLYETSMGAPPPATGFAKSFQSSIRALIRVLPRIVDLEFSRDLSDVLRNTLTKSTPLLRAIDGGKTNAMTFHRASQVLFDGLSEVLSAVDIPVSPWLLPGGKRFLGIKSGVAPKTEPEVELEELSSVFTPEEETLSSRTKQPSDDLDEIYNKVPETGEHQLDLLNHGKGLDSKIGARVIRGDRGEAIDLDTPGPVVVIGPPKKRDAAINKIIRDHMPANELLDLVRSSIAVDSAKEIPKVIKSLRDLGVVFARKPKNRFAKPTEVGYRDLSFNVRYPNGHVGEIQIHLKDMLRAKDLGHKYYEVERPIKARVEREGGRKLKPEEVALIDEANDIQKELYDEAWLQAVEASNTGLKMAGEKKAYAHVKHYEYHDLPTRVIRGELPVMINRRGKEVVITEVEKFYREADPVSDSEYESHVKKILHGAFRGRNAGEIVRTAHSNPSLRVILRSLLSERA